MLKDFLKKIIVFIITLEARVVLYKYKPEIIAITGSVGKTSTKDAIAAVLSQAFHVRSAQKSFNSEIGVPLTILGCENAWGNVWRWLKIFIEGLTLIVLKNNYPKILIVEVGTDRPGDIRQITSWLKPDVVVVTAFPEVPVHVEFFESRQALIDEKINLVKSLKPKGLLVLNADDKDVIALKHTALYNTITFGIKEKADVSLAGSVVEYDAEGNPVGMFGKVSYEEHMGPLHLNGVVGTHLFYSVLAGLAVGVKKGVNIVEGFEALHNFSFPPGRGRLLPGVRESVITDDSYNASPAAMYAALTALSEIVVRGRKIVVLGDMLELGKWSVDEHKKIGVHVSEVADILLTVGVRSLFIEEAALGKGMKKENTHHFENSIDAGKFLKEFVREGDVVLIKGSQSIRMEKAIEQILREPEKKKELLVRQEDVWLEKK
ncbi:MAG: UDP-N-acetylmuramoyl-tripeptide--D-alanyl-D-alanine ligase [bacterium]|nr:UDP-N-acetylmuramoyl-tripeptide--D-alanyl-D-alanine ligase [bacterium]